jgi:tetratricopeptide (TPR) repeat protein
MARRFCAFWATLNWKLLSSSPILSSLGVGDWESPWNRAKVYVPDVKRAREMRGGSTGRRWYLLGRRWLPLGAVVFALFAPLPASAQQTSRVGLQHELDQAYQRLLVDPSDRALNRRMIDLAVALDDYDAAIGAVERLIFYEPGNASLQLEAARFYLAIGSFAAARGYLDDVLALPNLPADVRRQVEEMIAQIDKAANPSLWAGFGQVGVRYQSNANIGPAFLGPDEPFFVDGPEEDWNAFALGTLAYANPVGDNTILEAQVSGYYADQFNINRLDLGFLDITVGPRFVSANDVVSIKPYAVTQGILLGSDPYQFAFGGGILTRIGLGEGWWIEPQAEYKRREYYNSDDYEDAADQTGNLYTFAARLNGDLTENVNWSTRLAYNVNRATSDYQSFDYIIATTSLRVAFDLFGKENWAVTPFASISFTDYKGLAPTEQISGLDKIRQDLLWSVGAILEIPFNENFSFNVQVQYTENDSNLDRYTYDNLQVMLGPAGRF